MEKVTNEIRAATVILATFSFEVKTSMLGLRAKYYLV